MGCTISIQRQPASVPVPSSISLSNVGKSSVGRLMYGEDGADFNSLPLKDWKVAHVLHWAATALPPLLDDGSTKETPYTTELCTALAKHSINGSLLKYLYNADTLQQQLDLDSKLWASRLQLVADVIGDEFRVQSSTSPGSSTTPFRPSRHESSSGLENSIMTGHGRSAVKSGKSTTAIKPYAVVSYSTRQNKFKDYICHYIENQLGIEAWSGGDVVGGAGGGYWAEQWYNKATADECKLIIFVLSNAFALSPACKKEFTLIFEGSKVGVVVPLMYETFEMPPWMFFNLADVNYIMVTPSIKTTCPCAPKKCDCIEDSRSNQDCQPDEVWHPRLLEACHNIYRPRTPTPQPLGDGRIASPESVFSLPVHNASTLKQDQENLLQAIVSMSGIERGKLKVVGVVGSVSFYNRHTECICQHLGRMLAQLGEEFCLVTGGFHGVGEAIARAFCAEADSSSHRVFMVLPETDPALRGCTSLEECELHGKAPLQLGDKGDVELKDWDFGDTLRFGQSVREREAVLAWLPILLCLEGGPGAANEIKRSTGNGKYVLPIGSTGGAAETCYTQLSGSPGLLTEATNAMSSQWKMLGLPIGSNEEQLTQDIAKAAADITFYLHTRVIGLESALKLKNRDGKAHPAPENMTVLSVSDDSHQSMDALERHLKTFSACYIVSGHGSRNQYAASPVEIRLNVTEAVEDINQRHGHGTWAVVYGGDPYRSDVQDVAHIILMLHQLGVPVVAVQTDVYKQAILSPGDVLHYQHLAGNAVFFYPTDFHLDSSGTKQIDYGGKRYRPDGTVALVGWSKVLFDKRIKKLLTGHVAFGGGSITRDDCQVCLEWDIPIFYIKMQARNTPVGHLGAFYGEIDSWASVKQLPVRIWTPHEPMQSSAPLRSTSKRN